MLDNISKFKFELELLEPEQVVQVYQANSSFLD